MQPSAPIVISTWNHGLAANAQALRVLAEGGSALDAAEAGVMETESDCTEHSVGLSGYPDRDGVVTLDAAVMDCTGRAGSVACVRGVAHPISLARLVMERTPHVMLVGEGAEQFARANGIPVNLSAELHPETRAAWLQWRETQVFNPQANSENARCALDHDTIGMLVLDCSGRLAASCTTSGLAFKMPGRVGDSPVIGAGLYVDGDVGAAVCTGLGEVALRTMAAFLTVECMRGGATPQQACESAVQRMMKDPATSAETCQVGVLALSRGGNHGAFAIRDGFTYALGTRESNELLPSACAVKRQ